jgi:hypothetical protein
MSLSAFLASNFIFASGHEAALRVYLREMRQVRGACSGVF